MICFVSYPYDCIIVPTLYSTLLSILSFFATSNIFIELVCCVWCNFCSFFGLVCLKKEIFNLNWAFYKDLKNPSAKSWLQILPCDGNVLSGFQMASYHAWEMCLVDYRSASHLQQFKYQQSLFGRWSLFGLTPAFFPGFQPAKLH